MTESFLNSVSHHDISIHTYTGLTTMKFGAELMRNDTMKSIEERIWPVFASLGSETAQKLRKGASLTVSKSNNWLHTIEDRVLILHFAKPSFGDSQQNSARTLSFFGNLFFQSQNNIILLSIF